VIHRPHVDWFLLAPSNALLAGSMICLLGAVLFPSGARRAATAVVCAAGFVTAFVLAVLLFVKSPHAHQEVGAAAIRDRWGALSMMIVAGAGFLTVLLSARERMKNDHIGEYFALLAAAGGGMAFLGISFNLMTLFLGLEWFSICLYVLCAIGERERSLESGLKYLIIGSFGSAVLLFGLALVYGATGELNFEAIARATTAQGLRGDALLVAGLAMILTGLGFKASAAPFHQWTPDVYEGAPTPITAFMSAATKTVALVLMFRVLTTAFPQEARLWTYAVAAIACASLAIGNIAALVQRNVKRILAYSSVSHAGFMLIAVAANNALGARALMYYLVPYCAMSIGAFAVLAVRERELGKAVTIDNLGGLFGWERPFLGASLALFMFGFIGFPPTGGFVGKFYVFAAAWDRGWTWLIIVGVAATAISLYYYLGIIRALFMRPSGSPRLAPVGGSPPREWLLQLSVLLCVGVTVGSFVFVGPLIDVARHAAAALPL
jgi:NADH-quinone oxidoreductase subunit N